MSGVDIIDLSGGLVSNHNQRPSQLDFQCVGICGSPGNAAGLHLLQRGLLGGEFPGGGIAVLGAGGLVCDGGFCAFQNNFHGGGLEQCHSLQRGLCGLCGVAGGRLSAGQI